MGPYMVSVYSPFVPYLLGIAICFMSLGIVIAVVKKSKGATILTIILSIVIVTLIYSLPGV